MFTLSEIRGRLAAAGATQHDLADVIKMHPTRLSHILNGRRPAPDGFRDEAMQAIDRLERAERAADEARRRVLAS